VEQDFKEAVKWLRKAADQGYAEAQSELGSMYFNGQGVPKNGEEAGMWFLKAAEQGHAVAQYNLGFMFGTGQGVPKNNVASHAWIKIAATNGNATAMKLKPKQVSIMTPDQIAKAEALVKEMVKKNPKLLNKK